MTNMFFPYDMECLAHVKTNDKQKQNKTLIELVLQVRPFFNEGPICKSTSKPKTYSGNKDIIETIYFRGSGRDLHWEERRITVDRRDV